MSSYLFIAISFYLNIVCKNIVGELGLKHIYSEECVLVVAVIVSI